MFETTQRSERRADDRDCREDVALDELGFDAQHAHAVDQGEVRIARAIALTLAEVHAPVDLDRELVPADEEVDHERMQDVLPPHARPELSPAKLRPEQSLAPRRSFAHLASELGE